MQYATTTATAQHQQAMQAHSTRTAAIVPDAIQYPTEQMWKTPSRMLHVIALALDMDPECYRWKKRDRNIVELRFLAGMLLRRYFPALTLQQIANYFGGQDHTSVIHGISKAHSLIYVRDPAFVKKYNAAILSISAWLKRDVSAYA
jgi:chromosomal replication initiation ATPase DnaA